MLNDVPAEFVNFLTREQERAWDTTLQDRRATAINFYQGEPFGDEVEGRSQAITRDVSEVADFLVVGILGTIMASGKVVEFESEPEPSRDQPEQQPQNPAQPQQQPSTPAMADYGEEATQSVQYQFLRKQKGYRILHDALKAGLLEKSGVVKTYAEMQPDLHHRHVALADDFQHGEDGSTLGGKRVVSAEPIDPEGMSWAATVAHPQAPVFRDVAVPNEFFRVSPDAVDLDDAVYVGERLPKTMSDMVKLGYDPAELEHLWGTAPADTIVEQARDSERSQTRQSIGERVGANKTLWLDEEYPLYDLDGDGVAERLFVHRIGNTVLKVMPIDEQPYSIWSPFPMQHRLIGQSVADKTMDIQRIRSVLLRQGLDSQYLSNAPRTLVDETSITVDTIDDLLTVRPGGLIRYKGTPPTPLAQNDTSAVAFQGMEMMSAERESRTGVTRQSQGLNPDTMNKTARGLAINLAASQQIELYITRNFAEMIVASIFAKRYRLMKRLGQPFRMKIQGQYQIVDPSRWPDEMDMSINVGLGTGNKDQKLQYRMSLLGVQQQIIAGGLPIVGPEQIYQNVKALVEDSGLGVASDYIKDPATIGPQPPQQDPALAKVQGEQMLAQQKEQNAHDQAMAKLSITHMATQNEAQIKAAAHQADLETKASSAAQASNLAHARAQAEATLAENRQAFEMNLAERRFQFDQHMAKMKHQQASESDDAIPANRAGGSLDA